MQLIAGTVEFSASDLVGHLNCKHLTALDLAVAYGALVKPQVWDPMLELLRERGARHEAEFIEHLAATGLSVTWIAGVGVDKVALEQTLAAMHRGDEVISQAALRGGGFGGRADVLRRVDVPSDLGQWSYEVTDTKLARTTKGGTVLQLCLYSDLVAHVQGHPPEHMHVVAPWTGFAPQTFRTADFGAYYRRVRAALQRSVSAETVEVYPDPKPHCDVCRWDQACAARRRADDHLSLVAGISKVQIGELESRDVKTTTALAAVPLPLTWKPDRGSVQSIERIRQQARIQYEGRVAGATIFERLPIEPGFGLSRLPAPSPGDIFLDLEGDPFVGDGGLEYLFGYAWRNEAGEETYTADWSLSRTKERAAFESFIDFVIARLDQFPDLHIYHYAPYEPAALKRLMGRYATRENEVDRLLRSKKMVDLFAVVRHAVRASVESYSIKRLEPLYDFERDIALSDANRTLARVEACLELGDPEGVAADDRASVQGYNRDDCLSTWRLRDWLEALRASQVAVGVAIERPTDSDGEASEAIGDWQARIDALVGHLTSDIPDDDAERSDEQRARWTLAHILDWHRREQKALWWEHFRLADLDAQDLLDERAALSGLTFEGRVGGTDKAPVHRYRYPPQDTLLRGDEDLRSLGGAELGAIAAISLEGRFAGHQEAGRHGRRSSRGSLLPHDNQHESFG